MTAWTLTPDGLKTDEQLWLDDFLLNAFECPKGCNMPLVRATNWEVCTKTVSAGGPWLTTCNESAKVACSDCGHAWCRDHADKED